MNNTYMRERVVAAFIFVVVVLIFWYAFSEPSDPQKKSYYCGGGYYATTTNDTYQDCLKFEKNAAAEQVEMVKKEEKILVEWCALQDPQKQSFDDFQRCKRAQEFLNGL